VIVVATEDFEVYHEVVTALRDRGVSFTTIEPDEAPPAETSVVITGEDDVLTGVDDVLTGEGGLSVVTARADSPREAVEEAVSLLRGGEGRRVVGIDPGEQPGVERGDEAPAVVRRETEDAEDPLVRIGNGARLIGARIVDNLDEVSVELVDETGTTPYLGTGARGMGDVIAAINIANMDGERIDSRDVQPTEGELERIRERSRSQSAENRTIGTDLARRVALGELSIDEALDEHRTED